MGETQYQSDIHGIDRQGVALVLIVAALALLLTATALWIGFR